MKLSTMLKEYRTENGYTQKEFGNIIGVVQNNYSKLENGKIKISAKSLSRLVFYVSEYGNPGLAVEFLEAV